MARITFFRADDYSRIGLERIYMYVDRLHDIASEGHLRELKNMPPAEVIELVDEVIYTLEETIREIKEHEARLNPEGGGTAEEITDKEEIEQ
jgi:hypothetical protein